MAYPLPPCLHVHLINAPSYAYVTIIERNEIVVGGDNFVGVQNVGWRFTRGQPVLKLTVLHTNK